MFQRKKYVDHKVVSSEELPDNHDYEVICPVVNDEVVVLPSHLNGMKKEYVLRKTRFLVGILRDKYISNMKNHINIGEKNFPEYDRIKKELTNKDNEIIRLKKEIELIKENSSDHSALLEHIKKQVGKELFSNILGQHERNKKIIKKSAVAPVARG